MALDAGELTFVLEYATNLKDHDWFGKQDPYCIITCGTQTYRSRTATDGGRNPVWNQTFRFNVINDNDVSIMVKDEDIGPDDYIGTARLSLARARMYGSDRQQVPVINRRGKQHGYVHVVLNFTRSTAYMAPHAYGHTVPYPAQPAAYHPPPPYYGAPPPAAYTAPPYGAPPAAAYPPPAAYPPSPYGAPPPASPYHPYAPAPAPYPAYGAAPAPAAYPPAPMGYPPVRVGYY